MGAGQFLPESRRITTGRVSLEVLNHLEGFVFIGQFQFLETEPSPQVERLAEAADPLRGGGAGDVVAEAAEADENSAAAAAAQDDSDVREMHVTFPEGYVYVRTQPREVRAEAAPTHDGRGNERLRQR